MAIVVYTQYLIIVIITIQRSIYCKGCSRPNHNNMDTGPRLLAPFAFYNNVSFVSPARAVTCGFLFCSNFSNAYETIRTFSSHDDLLPEYVLGVKTNKISNIIYRRIRNLSTEMFFFSHKNDTIVTILNQGGKHTVLQAN